MQSNNIVIDTTTTTTGDIINYVNSAIKDIEDNRTTNPLLNYYIDNHVDEMVNSLLSDELKAISIIEHQKNLDELVNTLDILLNDFIDTV